MENHHNAYSVTDNLRTPSGSSLVHDMGTAVDWTANEVDTLVQGLAKYSSEPIAVSRYMKIAFQLPRKNVRDVAKRCQWMNNENAKRRKEDHNGLGRARVDNKEIIDMVVASQPSHHQQGITDELLSQNEQWFSLISANLTSLRLMDNSHLFNKIRNNISTLLEKLKENVSETMKRMPALPDKLNDELFDAIFLHLNLHE